MVRAAGSPGNPPGAGSRTSVSIQRHLQLRCRSHAAVPRHMGRYAGHLPHENPYYRERRHDGTEVPLPANFTDPGNAAALAWAEAERALTLHRATRTGRRGRRPSRLPPRGGPGAPVAHQPRLSTSAGRSGCGRCSEPSSSQCRRSIEGFPTSAHATVPQVAALVGLVDVSNSRIKDMCHTSKAAMVHPARLFGHIGYEHCRNSLLTSAEIGLLLGAGRVGAVRLGTWAWTRLTGRTGPGWSRG
jgi:hypothetical protein